MRVFRTGDWWEHALQIKFKDEQEFREYLDRLEGNWARLAQVFIERSKEFCDFLSVWGQPVIAIYPGEKLDESKEVSQVKLPEVSYP